MSKRSYITFYQGTNIDYIKIFNSSNKTISEAKSEKDIMKTDTVLLTKYINEQLDASYFSMIEDSYDSVFTIYKKTPNQNYYQHLCYLTENNYKFTDYNIVSNQFYHYLVSVELSNTPDNGGIGYMIYENLDGNENIEYIHTLFDGWSICDIEVSEDNDDILLKSGRTWNLGLNVEGESINYNTNIVSWDTLGKYPKFSKGNRNYKSMAFTGLLGNIFEYNSYKYANNTNTNKEDDTTKITPVIRYTEKLEYFDKNESDNAYTKYDERWGIRDPYARENDKLEKWEKFITNGSLKLLKDIKGNAWIIQVVDSITSSINTAVSGQPTTVSFQWKEALDISEKSIVIYGDNTNTED